MSQHPRDASLVPPAPLACTRTGPHGLLSRKNAILFSVCLGLAGPSAGLAADLYREADFRALTADQRARQLGDTLSVMVVETSSATSSADTGSRRNTEAGLSASARSRTRDHAMDASLGLDNNFTGGARTARTGRLLAQIAVRVVGVEPNGDLLIAGEQLLDINDEQQRIRIEGRVRRDDIGENNAVLSSRIADARIHYAGQGVLADGQRPGFMAKVLRWLGL